METGQVIQWLKSEGDYVEAGEPLLEIETDKVSMEVEAEVSGYLLKIIHGPGDTVPVIQPIGYIGQEGEESPGATGGTGEQAGEQAGETQSGAKDSTDKSSEREEGAVPEPASAKPGAYATSSAPEGKIPATPAAKRRAGELGVNLADARASGPHGEVKLRDIEGIASDTRDETAAKASPLARRIASDESFDLAEVEGSGPGGRILREDVIAALAQMRQAEPGESGPEERERMSGMRRTISQRMLQSHLTMPPVTLDARVDVTDLMQLRRELNESGDLRYSLNDLILKATARAVREHEAIRTAIDGDELVTRSAVSLGMAVAVDSGLLVPVIPDADSLALGALARKARDLGDRARDGKLSPDELKGGTFSVTNLGMYGIHSFTPIINPPQSAILGVNAAEPVLRKNDDNEVVERMTMTLSLTIDHRVIDGAQGAKFLATMRALLENPMQILV